MGDFFNHLETLGVSFNAPPAAVGVRRDYGVEERKERTMRWLPELLGVKPVPDSRKSASTAGSTRSGAVDHATVADAFTHFTDRAVPTADLTSCREFLRTGPDDSRGERRVEQEQLRTCIKRFPRIDLGYLRLAQELPETQAIETLNAGLEQCHRKSYLLKAIGQVCLEAGRPDEAIKYLTSSIYAARRRQDKDIGESYIYLSLLFLAAHMKEGAWVDEKGSRLSGLSMDAGAISTWVHKIRNSGALTSQSQPLLVASYALLRELEKPASVDASEVASWRDLLLRLPVKTEADVLATTRSIPLWKKVELAEIERRHKLEGQPLKDVASPTDVEGALTRLEEFRLISEHLKSEAWIDRADFEDLKMTKDGEGFACIWFTVDHRRSGMGTVLEGIRIIRTGEDAFYVC